LLVSHTASDLDLGDADRRRRLTVTAVSAIVLPPLELHDHHLPAPSLTDDLARDFCPAQRLLAGDHLAVARDQQAAPELHAGSRVARHLLDRDHLPGRYTVLVPPARAH